MHFVGALDAVPGLRGVLTLFEGVATGAADGYARIAEKPAAVLLHLGPGLGNGLANLHNARRAGVPVVVIVGDHATYHKKYDTPLESDIDAVAGTVSGWLRRSDRTVEVGLDAAAAIRAAIGPPSQVATLILPANVSWSDGAQPAGMPDAAQTAAQTAEPTAEPTAEAVAATALQSGRDAVLLIGGAATREPWLSAAARIRQATGARLLCETFPTRWERGAGVPQVTRLPYLEKLAAEELKDAKHLILAGARAPVSFFAYPKKPGDLVPAECAVHQLEVSALHALAELVAPDTIAEPESVTPRPKLPPGPLNGAKIAEAISELLPEHAIVVDESNTAGFTLLDATAGAPRHDWLTLTGGAIGYGLPAATGAAIAVPNRRVLCLEADGSAMYTISALWTHARENLNITTVIYNNRSYDILRLELLRVGRSGPPGPKAQELLQLKPPELDFVAIATGMGVPARRAITAEEFSECLSAALREPGPHLIDAVIEPTSPETLAFLAS